MNLIKKTHQLDYNKEKKSFGLFSCALRCIHDLLGCCACCGGQGGTVAVDMCSGGGE